MEKEEYEKETIEEVKWKDEDDSNIKINLNSKNRLKKLKKANAETEITAEEFQKRLREQYKIMNESNNNIYKWATQEPTDDTNKGELDLLLQTNHDMVNSKKILSSSNILKYQRLNQITKDNNQHNSITTTINFHPSIPNVIVTTGLDKRLKIFQINEKEDRSKLTKTINSNDIPITSAKFLNNDLLIFTGKRKHYYTYDMQKDKLSRYDIGMKSNTNELSSFGKCFVGENKFAFGDENGNVYIYNTESMRYSNDIKIQGEITSVCFDINDTNVFISNKLGEIYLFDLRKYRNCINKINDFGNFSINCMELSNNSKYLATGSKNGYVNLYEADKFKMNIDQNIEPIKVFDNLTTLCDYVRFSNDSTILGMSSRWKKNGLRLARLDNMRVYSNYPQATERIKYPICFDFNCDNSYFAVGNDEGKALLYKTDY